mmetsp:Transcript_200/g.206  ORF Transcript_200/g.206 Transcript_200/m.206 type:complete len:129 (-) Transcript_200:82-468(-)
MYAIENGALQLLILWDKSPIIRYSIKSKESGEVRTTYALSKDDLPSELVKEPTLWDVQSHEPLLDWIVQNPDQLGGVELALVSDQTAEAAVFISGFGGVGGLLRYHIDLPSQMDELDDDYEDDYSWAM